MNRTQILLPTSLMPNRKATPTRDGDETGRGQPLYTRPGKGRQNDRWERTIQTVQTQQGSGQIETD